MISFYHRCRGLTKSPDSIVCLLSTLARTNRIKDVLEAWQKTLQQSPNVSEPDICVEYVVAHALGKKTLYSTSLEDELTDVQIGQVENMCKLCQTGMPVQYVLGEWDFHDLTLKMKPPILIPRPETEELADLCTLSINECEQHVSPKLSSSLKFLEVGCGTGALSVCLLKRFKEMQAVAVDISKEACNLTIENADAYGVDDRLDVIHADFRKEQVVEELKSQGPFCLLVSNPPYVTTEEMKNLQSEIKWFEDPRALHGGKDGLDLINVILQQAPDLLVSGGHLWLEVGLGHPEVIRSLVGNGRFPFLSYIETALDFTGRGRFSHLMTSHDVKR